jgi:hypothetical protein
MGVRKQTTRRSQVECSCRLEVDDELEGCRLYDWRIAGLLAFEDFSCVDPLLTISFGDPGGVAHETAGQGVITTRIDRRDGVASCRHVCLGGTLTISIGTG